MNQTCFQLIGRSQIPMTMISKLEAARPSESLFAIYLGLNGSPELSTVLMRFQESLKFDKQAYLAQKAEYTGKIIAHAEEFMPGLRTHIICSRGSYTTDL